MGRQGWTSLETVCTLAGAAEGGRARLSLRRTCGSGLRRASSAAGDFQLRGGLGKLPPALMMRRVHVALTGTA